MDASRRDGALANSTRVCWLSAAASALISFPFHQKLLEIGDQYPLALFHDSMPLAFQSLGQTGNAPRIFRIQFAAGLKRSPVRRDLPRTGLRRFVGRVRGNP